MTRVKLPRPVAESIEQLRSDGFDNRYIIECALSTDEPCVLTEFASNVSFTQLMQALVEGYDVKGTPEDEIYAYYRKNQHEAWETQELDDEQLAYEVSSARMEAVEFTLNELNVIIKGINEK
jgi:hypothetical protein